MSSSASIAQSEGSRRSSRSSQTGKGAKSILIDTKDSPDHANISGKIVELDEDVDLIDVDSTAAMFKLLQKMVRKLLHEVGSFSDDFTQSFSDCSNLIFCSVEAPKTA